MNEFRILSLDGGGIRGAYTAGFLAEIERRTGCSVTEHFDLLAGTSTGGIIAAALALGEPAEKIELLYRTKGASIFTRRKPVKLAMWKRSLLWAIRKKYPVLDTDNLFQPKYNNTALSEALLDVYGHRTLEQMRQRLVMPSIDLVKGQTVVFKTPHFPGLVRDRDRRVVDAVLATTAAPTYFPSAQIGHGTAFVDGGLWANNPALVAIAEAIKIATECRETIAFSPSSITDIHMLSIGTGFQPYFIAPPKDQDGIIFWGQKIIDTIGSTQSQGTNFQAQYLLQDRLLRIDYPIPDPSWKLDCVQLVEQLVHRGREAAITHLSQVHSRFLSKKVPRYTPCAKNTATAETQLTSRN